LTNRIRDTLYRLYCCKDSIKDEFDKLICYINHYAYGNDAQKVLLLWSNFNEKGSSKSVTKREVIGLNLLVSYVFTTFLQGEIWKLHILIEIERSRIYFTTVPKKSSQKNLFFISMILRN